MLKALYLHFQKLKNKLKCITCVSHDHFSDFECTHQLINVKMLSNLNI